MAEYLILIYDDENAWANATEADTGRIMAVIWRFIAKSELRARGICVWSTMRA